MVIVTLTSETLGLVCLFFFFFGLVFLIQIIESSLCDINLILLLFHP